MILSLPKLSACPPAAERSLKKAQEDKGMTEDEMAGWHH